jgi:predicted PurR-regulated permease PerM
VSYWARVTLAVAATLIAVAEVRRLTNLLLLVLIALVLAVGLEPAVQWLARRRLRRGWAVTVIVVVAAVFLALFVAVLAPMLGQETRQFAAALPGYLADLQQRDDWLGAAARRAGASAEVQQFLAQLPGRIAASFSTVVGVAGTEFGRIVDLFTVGILCIYFMLAMPRVPNAVAALTKPSRRARVDRVLRRSGEKVGGYVAGNLFTSAVCGAATVVALLVPGVDYAVPLGMWAGVADLVPQVGAYLGAAPAVLVALAEGPVRGAATLLFFIAYQQFENYVLAAAVALGVTAWVASASASASAAPYCEITWGSLPKQASGGTGGELTNVRAGQHACFDRLVLDVRGGQVGMYWVNYVPEVRTEGAGFLVPLRGGAKLQVTAAVADHDANYRRTYRPANPAELVNVAGYWTFRQVAYAGSFEATTTVGLGVRARLPFRVFVLAGPGTGSRLVIDVAHRW